MSQSGQTFNLYCDESSYLENDLHRYMLLGSVKCPYHQVKKYKNDILSIKENHHFFGEIKWSNVSNSKLAFYMELVDWFFDHTDLNFYSVVIDKKELNHRQFDQSHDDFYYKMYYYLLYQDIDTRSAYNVYLDIKDNKSSRKVNKLKEVLNTKFGVFRNIQNVRSKEVLLVQIADFFIGAVAYKNNFPQMTNQSKAAVISLIEHKLGVKLDESNRNKKFHLFFIHLNKK